MDWTGLFPNDRNGFDVLLRRCKVSYVLTLSPFIHLRRINRVSRIVGTLKKEISYIIGNIYGLVTQGYQFRLIHRLLTCVLGFFFSYTLGFSLSNYYYHPMSLQIYVGDRRGVKRSKGQNGWRDREETMEVKDPRKQSLSTGFLTNLYS